MLVARAFLGRVVNLWLVRNAVGHREAMIDSQGCKPFT
jgi:hypothetical protein